MHVFIYKMECMFFYKKRYITVVDRDFKQKCDACNFNSDKGGVQYILTYMTKSKKHAKIPKLVLLFSKYDKFSPFF